MQDHNLFKPHTFEEGRHAVVGDCNSLSMETRWEVETPLFAEKIVAATPEGGLILDYGCGVGRLAKEVLLQGHQFMHGTDASHDMLREASTYVANERFKALTAEQIDLMDEGIKYDTIYCIYVLQHCPAIELRDVLRRIYSRLKSNGTFIYCSSDYRMAIRFDGKGFFDDRFLGVNIQDEIERFFIKDHNLFSDKDLENEILHKMITGANGGLEHPAIVYKRHDERPLFEKPQRCFNDVKKPNENIVAPRYEHVTEGYDPKEADKLNKQDIERKKQASEPQKLVIINDLSPGDVLLTSIAIRSLHMAYPGRFVTDMRSPCNELFDNNPYITKIVDPDHQKAQEIISNLKKDDHLGPQQLDDVTYIIAHYPEIHRSGMTGLSFTDGHRMFIAHQLKIDIPRTGMNPDFYFRDHEIEQILSMNRFKQLRTSLNGARPLWILNAGIKNDYTLKQYHHYQEVVDLMRDTITFVQIGHNEHNHPALEHVIDMRGKTNLRELAALIHEADGVLTPISLPMHLAAAFDKPCVVPAGAREGARWELYPNQRFLYYNGSMRCANKNGDGCWKSKIQDCTNKDVNGHALCMEMISPAEIVKAIDSYYIGGRLERNIVKDDISLPSTPLPIRTEFYQHDTEIHVHPFDVCRSPLVTATIMNTLRILKGVTPQDTYYEAYQGHAQKQGDEFMDTYHFMWYLGTYVKPKRILEIGCRTGISICQTLSAYNDLDAIEQIVLIDLFSDGLCTPDLVLKHLHHLNIHIDDKIAFVAESSGMILPIMENEGRMFDYILVDGCHEKEYAKQDLINATALIAQGGYIVFDDITPDGCNLQVVWDEFKENRYDDFEFDEDHHGKGIGIACKK